MNYYERHVGDYIKDTVSLTMIEDGAYNRLIDQCYQSEKPLPLDVKEVYREARANTPVERKAVDYVLGKFFEKTADGYIQKRVQAEIARYQEKQRKAKASADVRWSKAKPHSEGNANASKTQDAPDMRTHCEGNALQTPDTRHQTPEKKNTSAAALPPDGVSASVWVDFLKIRKAKRAPMTDTALDGIRHEAEKAGLTLEEVLQMCCARGWQGFKAIWLDDQKRGGIAQTIAGQRLQQAKDFAPGIAAAPPMTYIDEVKNVPATASR